MSEHFSIKNQTAHLWRVLLPDLVSEESILLGLLSPDEVLRANRFKFNIHRQRYVLARGTLRRILSLYTGIAAEKIFFSYGNHGKPYLENHFLSFNLSHSHDLAVIALTREYNIGVDIEKIESEFKAEVAKRFFSPSEVAQLDGLPEADKIPAFYQVWSKKESLIKALGEGLFAPLDTFSVSALKTVESVVMHHENQDIRYHLESFFVHPEYQAAYATNQVIENKVNWEWLANGPSLIC